MGISTPSINRVIVECDCVASYEVVVENSIVGWNVNIENDTLPKTFRYKLIEAYGE